MNKFITIVVNPEQKIFAVEKQVFLTANEEGLVRLDVTNLTVELPKSVISFEKEVQSLLTEDQQYALFEFLGKSKGTTITGLAMAVGITKEEAKYILQLGIKNGVLVTGWNSTWKVYDKIVRERLLDRVKSRFLQEKQSMLPDTLEEQLDQLRKKGLLSPKVEGEGEAGSISEDSVESVNVPENKVEKIVHVTVADLTKKNDDKIMKSHVENLQKELKALEKKLADNKDWNENETPHTVVNRINTIKVELRKYTTSSPVKASIPSHTKVLPAKKPVPGKLPARKLKP